MGTIPSMPVSCLMPTSCFLGIPQQGPKIHTIRHPRFANDNVSCLDLRKTCTRDICCLHVVSLCGSPSQVTKSCYIAQTVSESGMSVSLFQKMVVSKSFSTYVYLANTLSIKLLVFQTISIMSNCVMKISGSFPTWSLPLASSRHLL